MHFDPHIFRMWEWGWGIWGPHQMPVLLPSLGWKKHTFQNGGTAYKALPLTGGRDNL